MFSYLLRRYFLFYRGKIIQNIVCNNKLKEKKVGDAFLPKQKEINSEDRIHLNA